MLHRKKITRKHLWELRKLVAADVQNVSQNARIIYGFFDPDPFMLLRSLKRL